MRLKFTVHAQIRMQERGLQVDDIKKAINDPDFTKDAYEGKVLVRKELANGRTIEVVYFRTASAILTIISLLPRIISSYEHRLRQGR
jgi:uncharacterized DUF497 family protein